MNELVNLDCASTLAKVRGDIRSFEAQIVELKRNVDLLKCMERSLAGLVGEDVSGSEPGSRSGGTRAERPERPLTHCYAECAESVIRKAGRPVGIGEVIDEVKGRGHELPKTRGHQYTAIYLALKRRPKVFEKTASMTWRLVGMIESNQEPSV